jgi:hypothetical protein
MLAAAVLVAVFGRLVLPPILFWILLAMLVWAAVTTWHRTVDRSKVKNHDPDPVPGPLRPGETYDTAVRLTWVANVPEAEAICVRLQANGIEAFTKRVPAFVGISAGTSDFGAAEVWVGEHQLAAAQKLLA